MINIYEPNIGAPRYMKQIFSDIKGETNSNIIVVDLNISLKSMDSSSRQKISKGTVVLNDSLSQMDLTDIYRALHPKQNTHFFQMHTECPPG